MTRFSPAALKAARYAADYSLATVAEQLGVSRRSVAKWESGDQRLHMDRLAELADLYECEVGDFYEVVR